MYVAIFVCVLNEIIPQINPSDRTSENLNILYQDLKRQYDLILDRRKTLSSQATGQMGFAAIIETVLVGLMIAFTTNKDVQILLKNSEYYSLVVVFVGIGFFPISLLHYFVFWRSWNQSGFLFLCMAAVEEN